MIGRTYQAETMSEAMGEVKRDLGRDAVILRTRSFRKGGLLGLLGGRAMWEITACLADEMPQHGGGRYVADTRGPERSGLIGPSAEDDRRGRGRRRRSPVEALHELAAAAPGTGATLAREMSELKRLVRAVVEQQAPSGTGQPSEIANLREMLIEQEVAPPVVEKLLVELRQGLTGRELGDPKVLRDRLRRQIASHIPTAAGEAEPRGEREARVIAMIGPTGVGKTTTIAKLAANYKLRRGMRVGLITIDTYRIAAVDQLQTYAEIIEVPLRTVLSPKELKRGLYALRRMDVVLIDTTGRSHNDLLRLSQLRSFLDAAGADEVHLVVSAASSWRCMQGVLGHFGPLGANRVVVTKLDEAAGYGPVLNVGYSGIGPIAYITAGQEVPDDIAPADAGELARRIVQGAGNA